MNLQTFTASLILWMLTGCARELEGEVAVNISKSLSPTRGTIELAVNKFFLASQERTNFDINSLIVVRDHQGSLECTTPPPENSNRKIWFDASGYKWVRIEKMATIPYIHQNNTLVVRLNDEPVVHCHTSGRSDITLGVLFDAKPRPFNSSGKAMHGFDIALPNP